MSADAGLRPLNAVVRMIVRLSAMNSAAGTPLPATSAITRPSRGGLSASSQKS